MTNNAPADGRDRHDESAASDGIEKIGMTHSGAISLRMLNVEEAAAMLRISRNLAYELVRQQRLPHIRLGRRLLIPGHALERWVEEQSAVSRLPVDELK